MAESNPASEIQERRLKPVYGNSVRYRISILFAWTFSLFVDLIDKSNYKGAVQQIDRIVKKHGPIPSALVRIYLNSFKMEFTYTFLGNESFSFEQNE